MGGKNNCAGSANAWPEQEIVCRWLAKHNITLVHQDVLPLLDELTAPRILQDGRIAKLVAEKKEFIVQRDFDWDRFKTRIAELEATAETEQASFDFRQRADMRGIELWRKGHPDRELVMPDHADLIVFLMEKLGEIRAITSVWEGQDNE